MNWFATILRVVIFFIILTDLTELSVEFCVDEVFEDRGCLDMRIRRRVKRSSLGMPRKASHVPSTSISMFSDSFHSCDMCNLGASFAFSFHFSFMHHAGMR